MYLTLNVVAYAFNPSTQEAKVGESLISYWFEASLVYIISSRLVKATYWDFQNKTKQQQQQQNKKQKPRLHRPLQNLLMNSGLYDLFKRTGMCVCVCTCPCVNYNVCGMCMWVCQSACLCLCFQSVLSGPWLRSLRCLPLSVYVLLPGDRASHWTRTLPFQLGWLASKLSGSNCLHSSVLDHRRAQPHTAFYMDIGDSNSWL